MIRVLHVVNKMNRGGIETFLMNVFRNIDRTKVQFDFLTSETSTPGDYDDEIYSLGGRIYQVPSRKQGVLNNIKLLNSFFRNHPEYKIVHAHLSSLTNVSSLRVAKKYGVSRRIVHSHNTKEGGSSLHKYIHRFNQLSLKSYATDFFACSDLAAKWMYPNELFLNKEFMVINNGIETDKFKFNMNVRNQKRKELGVENNFVIGHVGRFFSQKNHDFLIDIFKEFHDKNSDSVLMLVGDGELRSKIEKKVDALGLTGKVIFTGVRSDISELLQAMDIFVFPSLHEGLPVTLVEAQASGLPCIVSNNITKQVKITNNIQYIDLTTPISTWVEEIMEKRIKHSRRDEGQSIINAGFDIEIVAQNLQDYYLSCK
ncbi:glycosyltransferase family 1 protein [Robertmurraya sp. FSL R5-0851]|uniref:glycosyltransferase family 1 protein n=1 Tax=Robertmurraya sp. FSL R5-0851 TaxID=2921584 RepID=UPI0030FCBAEC